MSTSTETSDQNATKQRRSLLATGFNSHGQLFETPGDIYSFTTLIGTTSCNRLRVLFAGWSTTVLEAGPFLVSLGSQILEPIDSGGIERRDGFGDHDGMNGCLDNEGKLYTVQEPSQANQASKLVRRSTEDSPLIGHIAQAQNGRIASTFKQAPRGRLCHVVEFSSLESFLKWFDDPSGEGNYPEKHHMLPGKPKQLLANTATFTLLMEDGEVYTWGDARYQSLGRSITGDDATPAAKPSAVDALGGLKIAKVASGGWINAVLSEDGALYIWGMTKPGSEGSIRCLRSEGPGAVSLIELAVGDMGPLDIVDVAVGDNHVALVAEGHRLFVVGENQNGQLGLEGDAKFCEDWTEVSSVANVQQVFAGPKTTFVVVQS